MKILITGISGVGKTTTLAELQKEGYLVIDADATGLCVWRDHVKKERVEYGPDGRDYQWLLEHGWYCDIDTFKSFLDHVREDKHIFVSGLVENMSEFTKLFDKIIVLELDKELTVKRLKTRTNNHFAKKQEEQDFIFEHQNNLIKDIKEVVKIDTDKEPSEVLKEIIKCIK